MLIHVGNISTSQAFCSTGVSGYWSISVYSCLSHRRITSSTRLNPKCKMYHPVCFRWICLFLNFNVEKYASVWHVFWLFDTFCLHSCDRLFINSQVAWASKLLHELSPIMFSMCNSAHLWPDRARVLLSRTKEDHATSIQPNTIVWACGNEGNRTRLAWKAVFGQEAVSCLDLIPGKNRSILSMKLGFAMLCESRAPLAFHVEAQVLGLSRQKHTVIWQYNSIQ